MRIHHLALRTKDLARLLAFYGDVLELAVVQRDGDRSVWLRAGDAIVMLEREADDESPIPPGTRELIAFATTPPERERLERRLEERGVVLEGRTRFTVYF